MRIHKSGSEEQRIDCRKLKPRRKRVKHDSVRERNIHSEDDTLARQALYREENILHNGIQTVRFAAQFNVCMYVFEFITNRFSNRILSAAL